MSPITVANANVSKKSFEMRTILSVTTGFTIDEKGPQRIPALMDFLFPGVFSMTMVAMMPLARDHIFKAYPFLKEVGEFTKENWKEESAKELKKLPATLEIEGPVEVTRKQVEDAISDLMKKMKEKD